jgi:hypothetical protein
VAYRVGWQMRSLGQDVLAAVDDAYHAAFSYPAPRLSREERIAARLAEMQAALPAGRGHYTGGPVPAW